jgi:hypothetical protein
MIHFSLNEDEFIQPVVGNNYPNAKKKYLLLGESNYSDSGRLESNHLQVMTARYVNPDHFHNGGKAFRHKFWTNIMQTITQRKRSEMAQEEIQRFWDDVILHDYVCDRNDRKIWAHIPEDIWIKSRQPFLDIVNHFNPDTIVFFSKKAHEDIKYISELKFDNEAPPDRIGLRTIVSSYTISTSVRNNISVIALPHPSWFFFYKRFSKYFS